MIAWPWTLPIFQSIVQQVPQSPVVHCTEWKEILQPNGTIVQERTCNQQ